MPALLCLYRCFGVYGISYISTSSPPSKSQSGARWARKADERRVKSHLSLSIRLIHDPGPLLPPLSIRAPIRFQSGTRSPTPPHPPSSPHRYGPQTGGTRAQKSTMIYHYSPAPLLCRKWVSNRSSADEKKEAMVNRLPTLQAGTGVEIFMSLRRVV